jgi:hypothetical protein
MGWLVRFVKNRDMAVENMVSCLSRQSALAELPPGVVACIRNRLKASNIKLPPTSLLKEAAETLADRGCVPGSYQVSTQHTRYNSRRLPKPPSQLIVAVRKMCNDLQLNFRTYDKTFTKKMSAGVKINGRPYDAGSHCEISSPIRRGDSERAGDASTFKVATIHVFYSLHIDDEEIVFMEVSTHTRKDKHKDIHIVKKRPKARTRIYSVDIIRKKLKFVSHWNAEITDLVCAIPMWDAS